MGIKKFTKCYDGIKLYLDDTYYGKIYAKVHCVTSVNLPDDAKRIQFSFSDAYNSIEKVKANI